MVRYLNIALTRGGIQTMEDTHCWPTAMFGPATPLHLTSAMTSAEPCIQSFIGPLSGSTPSRAADSTTSLCEQPPSYQVNCLPFVKRFVTGSWPGCCLHSTELSVSSSQRFLSIGFLDGAWFPVFAVHPYRCQLVFVPRRSTSFFFHRAVS